jgi:hypothetical protein
MKKFIFFMLLSIILVCGTVTAFSQEERISSRNFVGFVKDSENHPVVGAKVCGWDKSNRPINGRIPCVESQKDGKFALNIQKWEGDTYYIFVEDFTKGYPNPMFDLFERSTVDKQILDVDASDEQNPIVIQLGQKAGRAILKMVDDDSGKPIKSGMVEVCRIDNAKSCLSISTSFPNGRYEFLIPEAALTLKIKLWESGEWKQWSVIDENDKIVESIQVNSGETKEINIRLRQL